MNNWNLQKIFLIINKSNVWNSFFKYFIWKNKNILINELKIIEETLVKSDKYKEYDEKRWKICEKYCKKDEKWNFIYKIIEGISNYDILNEDKFQKELSKLNLEFEKEITEFKEVLKVYNQFLNEKSKIELEKIKMDNIPDEINQDLMDVLIHFDLIIQE